MRRQRDNAPIGNTCPDIDKVIEVLAGVSDRLRELSDKIDCNLFEAECNDIFEQSGNLKNLFDGRRSPLEELRSANETLRNWGNAECQRADEAEDEVKSLRSQISELESQ
jgi:hypothetical protein